MPWIAPDWQSREPNFEPGSLFWRTREFNASPVLYRTVVNLPAKSLRFAAVRIQTRRYAYLFITRFDRFSDLDPFGKLIARAEVPKEKPDAEVELLVDLTQHLLDKKSVVLALSAPSSGFRMEGVLVFGDGSTLIFGSEPKLWRAQKFPPLTVLEFEPCMRPDFDDRNWFPVQVVSSASTTPKSQLIAELKSFVEKSRKERLQRQMDETRWRLSLLRSKGIVIVDDEAFGWGGAGRLPEWIHQTADKLLEILAKGENAENVFLATEALSLFVWASDELTNLANHIKLWRALLQPERAQSCEQQFRNLQPMLQKVENMLSRFPSLKMSDMTETLSLLQTLRQRLLTLRHPDVDKALVINDLNWGLENKFGWFDTTALLDNEISHWGLRITTPATVFASPLSPAAFVTVKGTEFTLSGWETLKPLRVYQKPADPTPVCVWVVLNGKVQSLRPQPDGTVYDRTQHGRMSENWMLVVCDLSRGGDLPVQLVFLQMPAKVTFQRSEKGTTAVTVTFDKPGARLFVLKPLK